MRIILVRHGHPNYADDCLTPLGRKHAAAAAQRLRDEGIQKIFSSTCGRAMETARHTADLLGLSVEAWMPSGRSTGETKMASLWHLTATLGTPPTIW